MNISIASYSLHGVKKEGMIDLFGYLETMRYRYDLRTADIWNGFFLSTEDEYLGKIKRGLEERELELANLCVDGAHIWDKDNEVAQRSYANSPHKFVDKWDTPILIIHGQHDYRIAVTQAMSAFNAAKIRDVPTQFLYFPDENHWVLKPQNGILWQRTFFHWLDKWLKPPSGAKRMN